MMKEIDQNMNWVLINQLIKCQAMAFLLKMIYRYVKKNRDYDTLLLQIDSDDYILWGDCGIGNFFIPKKSLIEKDFSNVLYNWDCFQIRFNI